MVTDADKYGQAAGHDAVSTEESGAKLDDTARDALTDKIGGSLAALGGDPVAPIEPEVEEVEEVEEVAEEEESEEVEETEDDSSDKEENDDPATTDDEPADDEEAVDDDKKQSSSTLPATYRRSLKAYGWEDAEIDAALSDNAEQFTLTAMKIHRTRNDEISKFAEAGRRLRQGVTQDQQSEPVKTTPKKFASIDRDALIEKYGNEEIVDAILGPMQERLTALDQIMPEVRASVASAKRTQQETLGKMIDTFFGGEEMTSYEGLYGKPGTARTPEQTEKFNGVLELADAIVAGAAEQGRNLAFEDAMESAHADISKGFTEKAVRSTIKKTIKKRSKSLSLKPSHGGKSKKSGGKPSTRKQLETKTKAALNKVFS